MLRRPSALSSALMLCVAALAGCTTQPNQAWLRDDGRLSAGNPALERAFHKTRNECLLQTHVAVRERTIVLGGDVNQTVTVGGQAPQVEPPPTLSPSLMAAMAEGRRQDAAMDILFQSCMNANGYTLVSRPQ